MPPTTAMACVYMPPGGGRFSNGIQKKFKSLRPACDQKLLVFTFCKRPKSRGKNDTSNVINSDG